MPHNHGMEQIRLEAELEAKELIWKTAMALFDYVNDLHIIRSAHIANFPAGALTCDQLDELEGAIASLEEARGILQGLSAELPNKTRKETTK